MEALRDVVLVSRWFYPADIPLLIWLTGSTVLMVLAVLAAWLLSGGWRKLCAQTAIAIGVGAAVVCLAMIAVEMVTFGMSAPLCVAAYTVLSAVLLWLIGLSRSEQPRKIQLVASFLAAILMFAYLFPFGGIPRIAELKSDAVEDLEGKNTLGYRSARLLVTEFADFECAPCAWQDRRIDQLWTSYAEQIRYSFRHLPLRKHPYAEAAALGSQCAADVGKFWETKRLLFTNQHRLGEILSSGLLPTIAPSDEGRYRECVQSKRTRTEVQNDLQQAERLGIRTTPSIIIGNKLIVGMTSYARLNSIVKHELRARKQDQHESMRTMRSACGSPLSAVCAE